MNEKVSKSQIIDALIEISVSDGSHTVTLKRLATKLSVVKSTINNRFGNINNLFEIAFERLIERWITYGNNGVNEKSRCKKTLEKIWKKRCEWALNNPMETRFIFQLMACEKYRIPYQTVLNRIINRGINKQVLKQPSSQNITELFNTSNQIVCLSLLNNTFTFNENMKTLLINRSFEFFYNLVKKPLKEDSNDLLDSNSDGWIN